VEGHILFQTGIFLVVLPGLGLEGWVVFKVGIEGGDVFGLAAVFKCLYLIL
jgi:hypothetical protein